MSLGIGPPAGHTRLQILSSCFLVLLLAAQLHHGAYGCHAGGRGPKKDQKPGVKSHRRGPGRLLLMLPMAGRDPVLHELQDQPESESGLQRCRWHCAEHQAGHVHRYGRKTQLPALALFNEGARYHPADTNTFLASHLLTKASSGEHRAFPSMSGEWAASLQHREQDRTRSSAGPITRLCTPSPTPGAGEDTVAALQAPRDTPEHHSQLGLQRLQMHRNLFYPQDIFHKKSQAQRNVK